MYALCPNLSWNIVEKVESDRGNRGSGFGSNSMFFEKKKKRKKESHSSRIVRFKGKVFEQNTTRMGGDFVRNPKGLTLT